jgi:Mn2+/Fe2+ NRAMP family transporter
VGVIAADAVAFFIIVCTAATLHASGASIHDAADAARALSIPLGQIGTILFAAGLLSASLLTSAALPLATAYTYCEAFGWEIGLQRSVKDAPMFYGLFTATQVIGALVVLLPDVPLFSVMLISQFVNGMLLPVVLIFMLSLVNNRRIMGDWANGKIHNIITWTTVVILIGLTAGLMLTTIFPSLLSS